MSSDDKHQKRDAETNLALGAFIFLLGGAVSTGTLFAESTRAMVVNGVAGGILVAIGIAFMVVGARASKKLK